MDFFRGVHPWRKLRMLLERMPMASHYQDARANDPELAARVAAIPAPKGDPRPPLRDFTPMMGLLANMYDQLQVIDARVQGAAGGKPGKVEPYPRPRTLMDRAGSFTERDQHRALVSELDEARERRRLRESDGA